MAISTLLVVSAVCLIFAIFALVLALTDRRTTRWLRQARAQDEDRTCTRASFPDNHVA
jgi:cell division protein FtsX